jgi:endonuclease/exonuclease/phosphatase family metal-dependent hydrolase
VLFLDVLTMNLWGLPWPLARDRRARKRRFLDHLLGTSYDIVGIQELWWPWRAAFQLESLLLPDGQRDSGLALASRLQATHRPRVRHFRAGNGIDRLKHKGIMTARVTPEVGGEEISVHVTHLQAGPRKGQVRARQVDELLEVVGADPGPAIVMGDFNFHTDDPADEKAIARLASAGLEDAIPDDGERKATYESANPYVRRRKCAERFDRVFLKSGSGTRLVAKATRVLNDLANPFSDHHPLHVCVQVGD